MQIKHQIHIVYNISEIRQSMSVWNTGIARRSRPLRLATPRDGHRVSAVSKSEISRYVRLRWGNRWGKKLQYLPWPQGIAK